MLNDREEEKGRSSGGVRLSGEGFEIDKEDINTFVYLYKATINKT